jgi:hypothetical protein
VVKSTATNSCAGGKTFSAAEGTSRGRVSPLVETGDFGSELDSRGARDRRVVLRPDCASRISAASGRFARNFIHACRIGREDLHHCNKTRTGTSSLAPPG